MHARAFRAAVNGIGIRRALAADAPALARVAFLSKAHWGYDAEFMERVRPALTPAAERVADSHFFLAERAGEVLAFYGLGIDMGKNYLLDLWVVPAMIGTGLGRRLFEHAVATARATGKLPFFIESDPNAEGFYLRMGAKRVGYQIAAQTGRSLPLLRFD